MQHVQTYEVTLRIVLFSTKQAYLENLGVFAGFAAFAKKKTQKKTPNSGARGVARIRISRFFCFFCAADSQSTYLYERAALRDSFGVASDLMMLLSGGYRGKQSGQNIDLALFLLLRV